MFICSSSLCGHRGTPRDDSNSQLSYPLERKGGVTLATTLTSKVTSLWNDENGLVSSMEMTIGVMLTFVLIVSTVLLITYSLMGAMVDDAALVSARAGSQFLFPNQASAASNMAQQIFAKAIPESKQVICSPLSITTPSARGQSFAVSSNCTVDLGTFLGQRIQTNWTAQASVPVGPYSVGG